MAKIPTTQTCPKCGVRFRGNTIFPECDSCLMDTVFDVPFQFWTCPDHRRTGRVRWDGNVATCLECGRTNSDAKTTGETP